MHQLAFIAQTFNTSITFPYNDFSTRNFTKKICKLEYWKRKIPLLYTNCPELMEKNSTRRQSITNRIEKILNQKIASKSECRKDTDLLGDSHTYSMCNLSPYLCDSTRGITNNSSSSTSAYGTNQLGWDIFSTSV